MPVVVVSSSSSAEVDVVEGGVDRKVRRLLDDQRPLGQREAEARKRSIPADVQHVHQQPIIKRAPIAAHSIEMFSWVA